MKNLKFIMSEKVEAFIIITIIFNSITLGLETSEYCRNHFGTFLIVTDRICLAIFSIEIILKILYNRAIYLKNPWNIFDVIIVGLSYAPAAGSLSVLRSLRVFRIFLLISALPRLKIIVRSLIISLPSIGSIALLMLILFYVSAILATRIFGPEFPDWFGTLGNSLFTLFQIMTLESWAMGLVRPISEVFPYAYLFFVPFVLISSFIILNIFIAVIINAMTEEREHYTRVNNLKNKLDIRARSQKDELADLRKKLGVISHELNDVLEKLDKIKPRK